jgi:N-acyl-D-aspartate/D-glutamate deacylase
MLDVVIRNASIVDGLGGPPRAGDVGIAGARLAVVGERIESGAAEEIDAGGLIVSPGFIDLHTHSDVSLLSEPGCDSAIEQGVTTQAVGLCGFSAAPVSSTSLRAMVDEEPVFAFPGVAWDWTTIRGYREAVTAARPATNVTTFVGHNTLRRFVIGSADRRPTADELTRMERLVEEAIDEGARGFTTGLSYAPGLFASVEELAALAAVAARHGLTYHTHMRYGDLTVRESVDEALDTARRAGVVLNISHMYPRPVRPPEEADHLVGKLEAARADGLEVTFDLTIFPRGGGAWVQGLPGWARDGGHAVTAAIIRDPETRARLVADLEQPDPESWATDWDDQVICKVNRPDNQHLLGRTIGDIARERDEPPVHTALDLVLEDGQFWVAPTIKDQRHLDRLIESPLCVPIGDGFSHHAERHRPYGLMPKSFGTFPLLLGSYVRDRSVLSLPEAIRKVTSEPARRLGLRDRGQLERGLAADLVLFDPGSVANRATEADPSARPAGVSRVMVNGRWVVEDGTATGERPGMML